MKLNELLAPWGVFDVGCEITGLTHDSRCIKKGDLFFAYPGFSTDGRLFLNDAVRAGAIAILYEPDHWPDQAQLTDEIPCLPMPDLVSMRGLIASRFYGYPTQAFAVTGVTGTNGKTTIAYQLAQAHDLLHTPAAYLGTLGQGHVSALISSNNTTPEPLALQHFFYDAKQEGVKAMCMEVSSHALCQKRVAGVDFNQAIYTNLSHEHLDYHQTMHAYAEAKAMLCAMATQWAIINQDDAYASMMKAHVSSACRVLTYGLTPACDVYAEHVQMSMVGSAFDIVSPWGRFHVHVKTIGQFNVYNSLAVFSSLLASGYPPQAVVDVMHLLHPSPGRMEIVATNPSVIVDYAHTPDALDNALSTVAQLKKRHLTVVFGCGGDRDKTKRPLMGEVASRYADHVILTSDNPRTEEPMQIIQDILQGIPSTQSISVQADRHTAIWYALQSAEPDDLILIAGKGHETYQQIGLEKFSFSDQDVIRAFYNT